MITISLCMIVKNEEEVLEQCLESVSGICDEIIIVDTGSKDKTKKYLNFLFAILVPSFIHGTFNVLMNVLGNLNINYNNISSVFVFEIFTIYKRLSNYI